MARNHGPSTDGRVGRSDTRSPESSLSFSWLIPIFVLISPTAGEATAQTALRAHYANGQIWVVWQHAAPAPETFGIYVSDQPITDLAAADLAGRLFEYEYTPGALREQVGPTDLGWVIPLAGGAGDDTLAADEALFVQTVHAAGDRYYAVVPWGDTNLTSDNTTTIPAVATIGPGEEVTCHFQSEFSTAPGYITRAYALWADGREDPEDRRPDFPVMANPARNGMPSLFLVSARDDLGSGRHPVTYWLHGGQGRAKQSTPGSRQIYGIDPDNSLLVAHNDDLVRWSIDGTEILEEASNSWWFGWGIHHDPFTPLSGPSADEVIINYTQRRIMWIHEWLIRQGWVDPEQTSILGHSLGSAGTTALGKAFPNSFASCTLFNNGFTGPTVDGIPSDLYGVPEDGLRTNLLNAEGDSVLVFDVFDLNTPVSPAADLPFFRSFHGQNDDRGIMEWDAFVVDEYRRADSLGWGMQLYWDERAHAPTSDDSSHWASGYEMNEQTERDNVNYQEKYFANRSFPAFFNHRVQVGASDPGDGSHGTGGAGAGDDWGTWGGYHDWEVDTQVDELGLWEATIYLIGQSIWTVDNCPVDSLTSDFMIRKPQLFLPSPGEVVWWDQTEVASGEVLQSGVMNADADGRVRLFDLVTYRDPRRSRIRLWRPEVSAVGTDGGGVVVPRGIPQMSISPNPFRSQTTLRFALAEPGRVEVAVFDLGGRRVATPLNARLTGGEHFVVWDGRDDRGQRLPAGAYWLRRMDDVAGYGRRVIVLN